MLTGIGSDDSDFNRYVDVCELELEEPKDVRPDNEWWADWEPWYVVGEWIWGQVSDSKSREFPGSFGVMVGNWGGAEKKQGLVEPSPT